MSNSYALVRERNSQSEAFVPDPQFVGEGGLFKPYTLIIRDDGRVAREYRGGNVGWLLLGGTILFQALARHPDLPEAEYRHAVSVGYHGGRNGWFLGHERWSRAALLPCTMEQGSLDDVMAAFELRTGISLPEVALIRVGEGVVRYTSQGAKWSTHNPWELMPGAVYEVTRREQGCPVVVRYRAHASTGAGGQVMVSRILDDGSESETFELRLVLGAQDLLTLRRDGRLVYADLIEKGLMKEPVTAPLGNVSSISARRLSPRP